MHECFIRTFIWELDCSKLLSIVVQDGCKRKKVLLLSLSYIGNSKKDVVFIHHSCLFWWCGRVQVNRVFSGSNTAVYDLLKNVDGTRIWPFISSVHDRNIIFNKQTGLRKGGGRGRRRSPFLAWQLIVILLTQIWFDGYVFQPVFYHTLFVWAQIDGYIYLFLTELTEFLSCNLSEKGKH